MHPILGRIKPAIVLGPYILIPGGILSSSRLPRLRSTNPTTHLALMVDIIDQDTAPAHRRYIGVMIILGIDSSNTGIITTTIGMVIAAKL